MQYYDLYTTFVFVFILGCDLIVVVQMRRRLRSIGTPVSAISSYPKFVAFRRESVLNNFYKISVGTYILFVFREELTERLQKAQHSNQGVDLKQLDLAMKKKTDFFQNKINS